MTCILSEDITTWLRWMPDFKRGEYNSLPASMGIPKPFLILRQMTYLNSIATLTTWINSTQSGRQDQEGLTVSRNVLSCQGDCLRLACLRDFKRLPIISKIHVYDIITSSWLVGLFDSWIPNIDSYPLCKKATLHKVVVPITREPPTGRVEGKGASLEMVKEKADLWLYRQHYRFLCVASLCSEWIKASWQAVVQACSDLLILPCHQYIYLSPAYHSIYLSSTVKLFQEVVLPFSMFFQMHSIPENLYALLQGPDKDV